MDTRVAAIDVGTNSIKLVIADRDASGVFRSVRETAVTTRLGEGMHAARLREAAIRRTIEGLERFRAECAEFEVSAIAAVGTAAIREAVNQADFVERAAAIGVPVEAIAGEEEARLSFAAVHRDPAWRSSDRLLVMDVGGGSTEVIDGSRTTGCLDRISIPIGAVRLTENALRSDPPTLRQIDEANAMAMEAVGQLAPRPAGTTMVGVGGTLVNLAAMRIGDPAQDLDRIHGCTLTVAEVEEIEALLAARSVAERREIPGLDPSRADIILGGATIVRTAMTAAAVDRLSVSCRGLRWGLLYDRFGAA